MPLYPRYYVGLNKGMFELYNTTMEVLEIWSIRMVIIEAFTVCRYAPSVEPDQHENFALSTLGHEASAKDRVPRHLQRVWSMALIYSDKKPT